MACMSHEYLCAIVAKFQFWWVWGYFRPSFPCKNGDKNPDGNPNNDNIPGDNDSTNNDDNYYDDDDGGDDDDDDSCGLHCIPPMGCICKMPPRREIYIYKWQHNHNQSTTLTHLF